jgi:hypothetical protein
MRSTRLISAATAVAGSLALASAGTAAAAHHNRASHDNGVHAGACRLSLNVAPRLVTTGETALAYGQANCAGAAEAGQTVTLYERSVGSSGFSVAGTTTTDTHGFYQLTTPALTTNSLFYTALGSNISRHRAVRVAAQVTLAGPPEGKSLFEGIRTGRRNAVTFTGTVSPNDAGAEVVLQRQNAVRGNGWHLLGRTIVNSSGGFAITHAFAVPGASSIRVLVRSNRRNVASASNVLSYDISQAQNPSLTILSAADPIPYGGSTAISGTAAGLPSTALTLLGRTAHNGFAPLATTTTDAEGKYSFPAQSPTASTFYKVQGAGRSSAVLYEGVKYLLTATPSATSVQSGAPLIFSGTVTPARAGHEIYLERQNLSGTGFHVVAVGTVGAGGTYSITHSFFAPGTDVLRVKIPGDPENGGTASETFSIPITPVPPASLKPEPPSNSSLPGQGQV